MPNGVDVAAGNLAVGVAVDTERLERQLDRDIPEKARRGGEKAGRSFGEGFDGRTAPAGAEAGRKFARSFEDQLREMAVRTPDRVVPAMRAAFERNLGRISSALARGIIDPDQARRSAEEAAQHFQRELQKASDILERRGLLRPEIRAGINREMERAGREAGQRFGVEVDKGARGPLENLNRFLRGAWRAGIVGAFLIAANLAIRAFRRVGRAITETLERAGNVQALRESFTNITTGRGLDPDRTLGALRTAMKGLASDIELVRLANFGLQAGLPVTEEQMGRLAFVSRRLGRAVGRDATESFERLTQAIVKSERRILDELGITVNFERAHREFADAVGKTVEQLTDQEKIQARLNAVLAVAEERTRLLGEESFTAGERLQQVRTAVSNYADALAAAVVESPRLADALRDIGVFAADSADKMEIAAQKTASFVDAIFEIPAAIRAVAAGEFPSFGLAFGAQVGAAFGQRVQALEQEREIRKILAEDDRRKLFTMAAELRAQAQATVNAEERARLEERAEVALRRRRQLLLQEREAREPGTGGEPVVAEAEIKRLALVMAELRDLGVEFTDAFADPRLEAARQAMLAGLVDQERAAATAVETVTRLRDALASFREARRTGALLDLPEGVPRLEGAQLRLRTATAAIRQLLNQGVRDFGAYQRALDGAGVTVDEFTEAQPTMAAEVQASTDAIEEQGEGVSKLSREVRELLDDITLGVRGFVELAGAIGLSAGELDDFVNSAATAIQGVVALQQALAAGAAAGPLIAAGGAILGGAAGIIGQLTAPSAAERLNRDLQVTLRLLRDDIEKLREIVLALGAEQLAAFKELAKLRESREVLISAGGGGDRREFQRRVNEELARLGITMRELQDAARLAGIPIDNLLEVLITGKGDVELAAIELRALLAAIEDLPTHAEAAEAALREFLDSIEGRLQLLDIERELFDLTPEELLEKTRQLFLDLAELPDEVEGMFAGLDLGTAEGRAAAEALIQDLFTRFRAGALTAAELGGMSTAQFLDFLRDMKRTLDELDETLGEEPTDGGFRAVGVFTGATEGQMDRLLGIEQTILAFVARHLPSIDEALRRALVRLGGSTAGLDTLAALPPPAPATQEPAGAAGGEPTPSPLEPIAAESLARLTDITRLLEPPLAVRLEAGTFLPTGGGGVLDPRQFQPQVPATGGFSMDVNVSVAQLGPLVLEGGNVRDGAGLLREASRVGAVPLSQQIEAEIRRNLKNMGVPQ